jgi:signal transduction histidine kinase
MYLFHIILACIVFPAGKSLAVVALAASMQLLCLAMISLDVLPPSPPLILSGSAGPAAVSAASLIYETGAMFLIWVVIWYLASELVRRLRRRDRQLALANHRLEASLKERTLHMLQTTHQLKAPFAAIHAQTQLLLGGYCGRVPDRVRSVVERIASRSQALSRQIQSMLQLANLRSRGQTAPPPQECDLAEALETVLVRLEPTARQRRIRFLKRIRPATVHAASDHMTMLLENLVVNAISYSYDDGVVSVVCLPQGGNAVVVSVRDRGIGIPADKLPRVFEDYFRTDEAAVHNPSSTGLGLAIVRQVASEAGISILLKSAPGWGTRFIATLPRRAEVISR